MATVSEFAQVAADQGKAARANLSASPGGLGAVWVQ
jgi:hypothetical protein